MSGALAWEEREPPEPDARKGRAFATCVPEDYAYFAGHFPTYPVLAGVVQLHELVLPCVRRARPDLGALIRLTGLKFLGRIEPGHEILVVLRFDAASDQVDFEILGGKARCSTGRLVFAPSSEAAVP